MVDLEPLVDAEDIDFLRVAIMKHLTYTGSMYAEGLLSDFATVRRHMVKVMPREYSARWQNRRSASKNRSRWLNSWLSRE